MLSNTNQRTKVKVNGCQILVKFACACLVLFASVKSLTDILTIFIFNLFQSMIILLYYRLVVIWNALPLYNKQYGSASISLNQRNNPQIGGKIRVRDHPVIFFLITRPSSNWMPFMRRNSSFMLIQASVFVSISIRSVLVFYMNYSTLPEFELYVVCKVSNVTDS